MGCERTYKRWGHKWQRCLPGAQSLLSKSWYPQRVLWQRCTKVIAEKFSGGIVYSPAEFLVEAIIIRESIVNTSLFYDEILSL